MESLRRISLAFAVVLFCAIAFTSCKTSKGHCAAYSSIAKPGNKIN